MLKSGKMILLALAAVSALATQADDWSPLGSKGRPTHVEMVAASREYRETIQQTASMVGDGNAHALAQRHGLNILNVTWEDTGRYKGSSVGPNISDMTIQVGAQNPDTRQFEVTCMPVIRFPNFSDVTCDLDPRDFTLLVGNEKGVGLKRVSLYEFLRDTDRFLTKPDSWKSRNRSLLSDRDSKVLVSAQACFLPIPKQGKATFNPVLFNYQSVSGDPAVLTILATREGTSTTIIDNKRDAFNTGGVWGQRLFHNLGGHRTALTGERQSEFINRTPENPGKGGAPTRGEGLNMVLLIQVPLKQKHPMRESMPMASGGAGGGMADYATKSGAGRRGSDVENAVIGHGEIEGPFTEIDDLNIERDPRFPVRVTVQFYKATSNGVVSEADMTAIKKDIDRVYKMSDSVGSLVTGGNTGRPTEYYGNKVQPRDWWNQFWTRHEQNTGDTRTEAIAKLRKLLGRNYETKPVSELYLRDLLRK